jgi:PAS domain S-box-containing protein
MNYLHNFYLVEAEKARVLGQFLEAEELYEQAIAIAAEHDLIQEEALAYELAAKHYLARGREKFAQTYLKEAHDCYERRGATAKVKELETRYPQFFARKAASTSTPTTAGNASEHSAIVTLAQQVAERTAALQKSEANYRNLIQTANSIILRYDPQGRIHYMNDYGLGFLGYEEHELLGRTLLETIVPETEISGRDRKQFIQDFLRNPASYSHVEGENLCRDGRRVWVAWSNQAILDEQGQIVEFLSVGNDITQRKQAEEALQASESKLRTLIEAIPDPLFVLNAEGRFLEIIVQEPNLLWQPIEEMMGKTMHQLGKEQADEFLSYIQQVLRTQQILTVEYSAFLNGGEAWFSARIAPIDHDQVIWLVRDITQRKQAEEALQRSEAKFRTIFENSQVGIYRSRLSDRLLLNANQRFANLYGFDSPEEIIGIEHTAGYYVNPSDRQQFLELLKRDGEVRNFEAQMRKRDGTLFWVLFSSYLNAADGYIEGVVVDISDRKQAEAALQTSEERLRLALTASNKGLYDLNIKTEEIVVNPEYALMLGYDPATFHVTKSEWIESVHPDDRESVVAAYDACITGEVPNFQVEYRRRTQDGQWKWLLDAGKIVTWNESGEPIRALGVFTDIDDRKRAEAASILDERNRMAREIHDTLAQTFTGILAQVGAANQVLTDDLEATQAHLDLIKELALTGLSEARRSVIALRPQLLEEGSLQSALHRLVAQIRAAANDTTLYYEVKGTAYALPHEVESNLLRIGQEALTNAIRHANAAEIRVELIYEHDQFLLRVKDDGQGFGVGSIPSSEGFGLLGMSERAERINAQLSIASQPGQGTEITVTVLSGVTG